MFSSKSSKVLEKCEESYHCLRCFCGSESSGMATKVFLPLDAAHVRKHTRLQNFTFSGAGETGNEAIISHPTRNTCTIVEGVQGA